jgi:hypothetical protein
VFPTLLERKATAAIETLHRRFPRVSQVFLWNLPDLDHAASWFGAGNVPPIEELRRHDRPFGTWRTQAEIRALVERCGWHFEILQAADACRFHAILTR